MSGDPKNAGFRGWYVKNREKRLAYLAEYRRNNKVRIAMLSARKRAVEIGAAGEASVDQIQARIDFYGGLCWLCRSPWQQIDHVIPWAHGGSNWPANIRPICATCNNRKSSRPLNDLKRPSRRGRVVGSTS